MLTAVDVKSSIRACQDLHAQGRFKEALELAQSVLAECGDDVDARWRGLSAVGNIHMATEMFDDAIEAHVEALSMARQVGDNVHTVMSWNNLGLTFHIASAFDLAIDCYSRIVESPELVRAWPPYHAHANMASSYLHIDEVRQGLVQIRQALRLETPELVEKNPHSPVAFRHTFVQLAFQSNRVEKAEVKRRAREMEIYAGMYPDRRSEILIEICQASLEVAFGDRYAGIARMERQIPAARATPHVLNDALLALVHAERLAGRPERAMTHLAEWGLHLYADGPRRAKLLGLNRWLETGATLHEQMAELSAAMRPTLPPSIRRLLETT